MELGDHRLVTHLAPRKGAESDCNAIVQEEVLRLRSEKPDGIREINGMVRLQDDVFSPDAPFDGTLELRGDEGSQPAMLEVIRGWADRFGNRIHADLTTVLMGRDHVFIEPKRSPVRYQYLMRRNADFEHAAYLDRYEKIHSQFGFVTPGIEGYVQLHIDLEQSRSAAALAGCGTWGVDSISELYMESLATFLAAIGDLTNDGGAREDEEIFVDKARSIDFTSRVDWHD